MSSLQLTNFYMHVGVYKNSGHNSIGVFNQKRKKNSNRIKTRRIFSCQTNASERGRRNSVASNFDPKAAEKSENFLSVDDNIVNTNGIGIFEFLQGKSYFLTGVTGFLGKGPLLRASTVFETLYLNEMFWIFNEVDHCPIIDVLNDTTRSVIEKILRTSPEVRKIYVLIKADTREAALERLKMEIIDSDIFDCLRRVHGKSYQAFMLNKVIPVAGNVEESSLGMDPTLMDEIAQEIDLIIHSAANTTWDERYDVSLNINTRGPVRVLNFAKKCKKLCAFVHVSTAFVNRENKGDHIIADKPFHLRESLQKNIANGESGPDFSFYGSENGMKMKQLGFERARMYGWRNVYEFTKAMGEMLLNENREEIPIIIVRPSIIESTYKDPFPGWIQGNRMLDPLILSYGQGYLPLLINPEAVIDVIPVDMVVSTIIAAMAKHGVVSKPDLNIYHVGSCGVNPLMFSEIFDYCYEHFKLSPMIDMMGKKADIKRMTFVNTKEDFSSSILEEISQRNGLTDPTSLDNKMSQKLNKKCKKVADFFQRLIEIYEPYMSTPARYDMGSTEKLWEAMSEEEKQSLGFDVKSIDWKDFFVNIHVPGLKKHVKKN